MIAAVTAPPTTPDEPATRHSPYRAPKTQSATPKEPAVTVRGTDTIVVLVLVAVLVSLAGWAGLVDRVATWMLGFPLRR